VYSSASAVGLGTGQEEEGGRDSGLNRRGGEGRRTRGEGKRGGERRREGEKKRRREGERAKKEEKMERTKAAHTLYYYRTHTNRPQYAHAHSKDDPPSANGPVSVHDSVERGAEWI